MIHIFIATYKIKQPSHSIIITRPRSKTFSNCLGYSIPQPVSENHAIFKKHNIVSVLCTAQECKEMCVFRHISTCFASKQQPSYTLPEQLAIVLDSALDSIRVQYKLIFSFCRERTSTFNVSCTRVCYFLHYRFVAKFELEQNSWDKQYTLWLGNIPNITLGTLTISLQYNV